MTEYKECEEWEEEEDKWCLDCCYFVRVMDDLYRHRGTCAWGEAGEHARR